MTRFSPVTRAGFRARAVLLAALSMSCPDLASHAVGNEPVADSREVASRIVIAGRQRMLAEGMAAKLCFIESGVAREESLNEFYVMWNIFSWYHRGISGGNPQLQLSTERSDKVLESWNRLDRTWQPLKAIYEPVLDGGRVSDQTFARTIGMTAEVTDGATDLVAALRSAYADQLGPQGFGAALLLDLYERQRMLAQKIAKDVCLLARGEGGAARREELSGTATIFALSLDAFLNGREDVSVPKPPTPEIASALDRAQRHWLAIEGTVRDASGGRAPDGAGLATLAETMDRFIAEMTVAINGLVSYQERGGG